MEALHKLQRHCLAFSVECWHSLSVLSLDVSCNTPPQVNNRRIQDEADTVIADGAPHAAAPPMLDPIMEMEGHVMYKNLLGPGQNMSHVPGKMMQMMRCTCLSQVAFLAFNYKGWVVGGGVSGPAPPPIRRVWIGGGGGGVKSR